MSSSFTIHGQAPLSGQINVFGSKNAALPLLAAAMLTEDEVTLHNMPAIRDIESLCHIMRMIGAEISSPADGTIQIRAASIDPAAIPSDEVGALRGSILLLGALLGRDKKVTLPLPGGDIIGARPIDAHLDAFQQLGARVSLAEDEGIVTIDGENLRSGRVVLSEFSVTATENILLVAACLPGTTTIQLAAAEPHVVALANLLTAMGARITGAGTHTIEVTGTPNLRGATFTNIPDMLEAGLFILLGAVTQSNLEIHNVPLQDLVSFFKKIESVGIAFAITSQTEGIGIVTVSPSKLRPFRLQALPHPGLATDLQAPFAVVATQADGSSLIHDPLYEGRFKHIQELQKMGADTVVCDPHRVIINGPTPLVGRRIPSLDIRSGATLLLAGLIAQGDTIIDNAEIIERGYAQLPGRLRTIGADIEVK